MRTWSLMACPLLAGLVLFAACGGGKAPRKPAAAVLAVPAAGTVDTLFTLDASGCRDAEDPTEGLLVRWDMDSDGVWDTPYSTEKTLTHQFTQAGLHTVTAEVCDSAGMTAVATCDVRVRPAVSITPSAATPTLGEACDFVAEVRGLADTTIVWSATGGSVSAGRYTAPLAAGTYTVTAAAQADPEASAVATVTVQAGSIGVVIE